MEIISWLGVIIFGIITGLILAYLLVAILYSLSNNHGDTTGNFRTFTGRNTLHFINKQDFKENPKEIPRIKKP